MISPKTNKELAYLHELFVATDWGERFAELIDEHVKLPQEGQALYLGSGTGGPEQYTGRSMPDTHRGMNISSAEYEAVADDIRAALIKHGIDPQTRSEAMAVVQSLKEQIVGI